MSVPSSAIKSKKKVIFHVPTSNQFEDIKPIEVKCFTDENRITIETEKKPTDVTATMMTIVPQPKRPTSVPSKNRTVTTVTDMITAKPIRHLAILPSAKKQSTKGLVHHRTNLSETFTIYDGPTTTPNVGRSLDNTLTINDQHPMSDSNFEIPVNVEPTIDDTNLCDNTIVSSVCELVDQSKLQQKPYSLIGRYQLPTVDTSSKPTPSVHIATVHYSEVERPETANKQLLIQQFYSQLEKMKATFNTEQPVQMTTNTLTFDDGQVKQTLATNQLKEKTTRISSATAHIEKKKPPLPKKQRTTKNPSSRIHSAPVAMATRSNIDTNNKTLLSKQCRNEKKVIQQKKILHPNKPIPRVESAPPVRIDIRGPEVTLLPHDEQECRQLYDKLQRLQPDGACVDINTLRRALYPPVGTTTYSSNLPQDQTSAFRSYRQRTEEMPQSWTKLDDRYVNKHVPKQSTKTENNSHLIIASDNTNIDRIADQVEKHAAINYCYYTRTK